MARISDHIYACALGFVVVAHMVVAKAATEKVEYSFCSQENCADGEDPLAGLIDVDSTLYGTTAGGGSGKGAVFMFDPATGAERALRGFRGGADGAASPFAPVIDVNGILYGTSAKGGHQGCQISCGTVFSVDATTGARKILHSFQANGDGYVPYAGLIDVGGTLYGTTTKGGTDESGTLFSLDPKTRAESVVHSFQYIDGAYPSAGLINVGGILYGTAYGGGAGGYGAVFSFDPATSALTVLHSFDGSDGWAPWADLICVKGVLYGTTYTGGANLGGTVFSIDLKTGNESVLYSFQPDNPQGGVTYISGVLYGTTYYGGGFGYGMVYSLDLSTDVMTVLHAFDRQGKDGYYPVGDLVRVGHKLYGTTSFGGAHRGGTVYSITP